MRVVLGHIDISEQLYEQTVRDEEAWRNPPPDWELPDDWDEWNESRNDSL